MYYYWNNDNDILSRLNNQIVNQYESLISLLSIIITHRM